MGWYDKYILPRLVHCACNQRPIHRQRQKLVPHAKGDTLEIGVGTGLNLAHYNTSQLTSLRGLDPSKESLDMTQAEAQKLGVGIELMEASAEQIPLPDASVDTVVMTYALCTIPNAVEALREIQRVLRPGGELLFCEHGLAPDESVRKWQRRIEPLWGLFGGGCHLTRHAPDLLEEAGFFIASLDTMYLPGWKFASFNTWGTAKPKG